MKIITWNINGFKGILKKENLYNLINEKNPNIFCLSETKIGSNYDKELNFLNEKLKHKYFSYFHNSQSRKGYSGTAIFTKKEPDNIIYGLSDIDNEGRVITCEFKKFYLVHVYTPNSGEALQRLDFRVNTWDIAFYDYITELQKKKPTIICGDLNVAHHEIDLKNPKKNLRTAGYTIEERNSFTKHLEKTELIDSFRYLNPELVSYSYWSYKFKCREKNIGWRIDYYLIPPELIKKVSKSIILTDITGSDHAPIFLEIKI